MQIIKKFNFDRFKKSARGLIDFAILIEQADPINRQKIMEQAESQDKDFFFKVMRKVVFFEELCHIEDAILAEILSKTSSKILAYALLNQDETFKKKILAQIGFRERKMYEEEIEKMGPNLSPQLALGAQRQILKMARQLESQNKFSFELSTAPRFSQFGSKKAA